MAQTWSVAQALALGGSIPAGSIIQDTANQVADNIDALGSIAGLLSAVTLTSPGQPGLTITPTQAATDHAVLALITGPYTLQQKITASQAAILPPPASGFTGYAIVDTAANVAANIAAITALHNSPQFEFDQIRLTDPGTPVLHLSAQQVGSNAYVLNNTSPFTIALTDAGTPTITLSASEYATGIYTYVLPRITTSYTLASSAVLRAATVASIESGIDRYTNLTTPQTLPANASASALPAGTTVVDTYFNVAANLDALQPGVAAGKITSIDFRNGGAQVLYMTAASAVRDAQALAALSPTYTLSQIITAAQAAAPPALAAGFSSYTVEDSSAAIAANLAAMDALARKGLLWRINPTTGDFPLTLTADQLGRDAYALDLATFNFTPSITLTNPAVPITVSGDLIAFSDYRTSVLNAITSPYTLTVTGDVSASTAAAIGNENNQVLKSLNGPLNVIASSGNVVSALGGLQKLLNAGELGAITLTGGGIAQLGLSQAQQTAYQALLTHVVSPYVVPTTLSATTVSGTLDSLEAQAAAGTLTGLALSDAGTPMISGTAALLSRDILVLTEIGSNYTITITDGGTNALTLAPWQVALNNIATVLSRINKPWSLTITGPIQSYAAVSLASFVSNLTGPITVLDFSGSISNNLDTLETLAAAGKLASIEFTDGGLANLAITQAQVTSDQGVLSRIAGPCALSLITTAAGAAGTALPSGFTTLTVRDTALDVAANLSSLSALARSGLLAAIVLTDSGPLDMLAGTLSANLAALRLINAGNSIVLTDTGPATIAVRAEVLNDDRVQNVLSRVISAYTLQVAGSMTAYAASAFAGDIASLIAHHASALTVTDNANAVLSNLAPLTTLANAGLLGQIVLTDSSLPSLNLTHAQQTQFAAVLAKIVSPYTLAGATAPAPLSLSSSQLVGTLDTLENGAASGQLGAITLTDGGTPTLSLTVAQLDNDLFALDQVTSGFSIVTNAATPLQLTAQQVERGPTLALLSGLTNGVAVTGSINAYTAGRLVADGFVPRLTAPVTVNDDSTAIVANLDALETLAQAGMLTAIDINGGNSLALPITAAQATRDSAALALISGTFTLSLITTASATATVPSPFTSLTVQDTVANVVANLPALEAAAKSGRLAHILLAGSTVVTLDPSTFANSLDALALLGYGQPLSIVLTGGGTPTITLPGWAFSNFSIGNTLLNAMTGSFDLVVQGPVTVGAAVSIQTRYPAALANLSTAAPLTILDGAYALTAGNLDALLALANAHKLGAIQIANTTVPLLKLTQAQAATYAPVLGQIQGPFLLSAAGTVTGAASAITGMLDTLEARAKAGTTTAIVLTDGTTPTLSLSAATISNDALALSLITGSYNLVISDGGTITLPEDVVGSGELFNLLHRISGAFSLAINGPLDAYAAANLFSDGYAADLTGPVTVNDTSGNIFNSLDVFQTFHASIAALTFTDSYATPSLTASTATADAQALALIASPEYRLLLQTTAGAIPATLPAGFNAITITDTAANFTANLDAVAAAALTGYLWSANITSFTPNTLLLSAAQVSKDAAALGAIGGLTAIMLTDSGTPVITLQEYQITAQVLAALNRITGPFALAISGPVRPNAAALFISAGGNVLASLMPGTLNIRDSVFAVSANLDKLQTLAARGDIASIDLRSSFGQLPVASATQASNDATAIGEIITPHALSQIVTTAQLRTATTAPSPGFSSFTVEDTTANIIAALDSLEILAREGLLANVEPTDTSPAFTLSAATITKDADVFADQGYGVYPITLTDTGTPTVTVPSYLLDYNMIQNTLDAIVSPFHLAVTGYTSAYTGSQLVIDNGAALANLTTPLAVSNPGYSITPDLDYLQTLFAQGKLAGITQTDTAPLTITAAQLASDGGALGTFTGPITLHVTNVTAANAATAAASADVTQVSVTDTAANVAANLDTLEFLARAGELTAITLADSGTPSLAITSAQQVADADALALIAQPYTVSPPASTLSVQAYDWRTHTLLSGVTVTATAAAVVVGGGTLSGAFSLGNVRLDASGNLLVDLYVNAPTPVQALDVTLHLPAGDVPAFAANTSALPSTWTSVVNTGQTGEFGFSTTAGATDASTISGTIDLGTLSIPAPANGQGAVVSLDTGDVGTVVAPYFSESLGVSAASGAVTSTALDNANYTVAASGPAAGAAPTITAADALAALKIAVGINPNAAPAGSGLSAPPVSAYQLLAADVLGLGRVTAADALAILKMAVHLSSAPARRWEFVSDTQAVSTFSRGSVGAIAPVTSSSGGSGANLVGIYAGAVLDRFTPAATAQSVPTSYFDQLAASTGAPITQFGYAAPGASTTTVAAALALSQAQLAGGVAIYDSAANVVAGLDGLQTLAAAGQLLSVTLMETGPPTLDITTAQAQADTAALARILGIYRLDIAADTSSASSVLSLNAGALVFVGTPDAISLGSQATTIHYRLAAASGLETVAGFQFGTDTLNIDLAGAPPTALTACDTTVAGAHAVALGNASDLTHGVVLTGMPTTVTAASLIAQHISFAGGHALIA